MSETVSNDLHTESVDYRAGPDVLKGYLAYGTSTEGRRPGVLVVHEWWGQNDFSRARADALARLGYTALALDMFGDGRQAEHPDDAARLAGEVYNDLDTAQVRFMAAYDLLRNHPTVDPQRIAAIGFCFGGGVALEMARRGVPLRGVVSFHGSLAGAVPAHQGVVKARLLVLHGADDQLVPPEQVAAFEKEMQAAGVDYRLVSYPGALHAFTNPAADANARKYQLPLAYNEAADRQSWDEMRGFFDNIFAQ